jgi:hypothetical protein
MSDILILRGRIIIDLSFGGDKKGYLTLEGPINIINGLWLGARCKVLYKIL